MAYESSFVEFARQIGDGWARFVRGAVHGETLLQPCGSLGIGGESFPDMNWADVYGPDAGAAADALRIFAGRLLERGLPGVISATRDVAGEVAAAAAELGLGRDEHAMPLMRCEAGAERLVADRDQAHRLADPGELPRVAEVLGAAFGCPAWMCANMLGPVGLSLPDVDLFVSRVDGRVASTVGSVRVGACVGIYAVATEPRYQRRGAASAALSAAMAYHLDRGAECFGLHASEAGAVVYERLGFELVDEVAGWIVEVP